MVGSFDKQNNSLRDKRLAMKLKQHQVAAAAGISRSLYSMYELGTIPPATVAVNVARVLNSTVEELFSDVQSSHITTEGTHA